MLCKHAWATPRPKTEYSRRPLPLDAELVDALLAHRQQSAWREPHDWVFANDFGRPRWQETILQRQLKPAARRASIGVIGWHTFRYSTLLRSAGTDIKVQQELLRHANIQTTMDVYTQAVSQAKREANHKIVRMIIPERAEIAAEAKPAVNGS